MHQHARMGNAVGHIGSLQGRALQRGGQPLKKGRDGHHRAAGIQKDKVFLGDHCGGGTGNQTLFFHRLFLAGRHGGLIRQNGAPNQRGTAVYLF